MDKWAPENCDQDTIRQIAITHKNESRVSANSMSELNEMQTSNFDLWVCQNNQMKSKSVLRLRRNSEQMLNFSFCEPSGCAASDTILWNLDTYIHLFRWKSRKPF